MLNTTQNTAKRIAKCKKTYTVAKTVNAATNFCFNTMRAKTANYSAALQAALTANNIKVQHAINTNNTYAHIVISNAANMQNAIKIAKQIAKQHKMQIVSITAKQKTLQISFVNLQHIYKTLFTTHCNNKQHTVTHAQVLQLVKTAMQKYVQAAYCISAAFYYYSNSNTLAFSVQSNKQKLAANALKNLLIKHNIAATVKQNTQCFTVTVKNICASN